MVHTFYFSLSSKLYLASTFKKIKDLYEVKKYLGLRMERVGKQIVLNQQDYIDDIVSEYEKIRGITPRNTPLPINLSNTKENKGDRASHPIHDMLGKIRYLADRTRSDIMFPASFLARFAAKPTVEHVNEMYQVIGYLRETCSKGLHIGSKSGEEIRLFAMSDASFEREIDSKGQLLSYYLFLASDSGAFNGKSQKDKNVSVSSLHAELNALVETTKMIIYYHEVLSELHYPQVAATTIYIDNEGVLSILKSFSKVDNRSVYLINKINFMREQIDNHIVKLEFVRSENNIGTKSLKIKQNSRLSDKVLRGSNFEPAK
jgi:hypothetical protein